MRVIEMQWTLIICLWTHQYHRQHFKQLVESQKEK